MTTILGIDPGLDGAIAVLTEAGELGRHPRHADAARWRERQARRQPGALRQHHPVDASEPRLLRIDRASPHGRNNRRFRLRPHARNHRGRARRSRRSSRHDRAAGLEARVQHSAGQGEQGQRPQRRNQPMAFAGGALRPQVRLRPRRGGIDRARRPIAGRKVAA